MYSIETSSCFLGMSTPLPGLMICFSTAMAKGVGHTVGSVDVNCWVREAEVRLWGKPRGRNWG